MKRGRCALLAVLLGILAMTQSEAVAGWRMQKSTQEKKAKEQDPERAIANVIRGMQMDLESSSSYSFLSHINSAQFADYPRFADMIEQLAREDTLRVYFRQASSSIQENSAQTVIDAEMELTRNDSAAPPQHRSQRLVIDFQLTDRGWRIINLTPRDFFQPL